MTFKYTWQSSMGSLAIIHKSGRTILRDALTVGEDIWARLRPLRAPPFCGQRCVVLGPKSAILGTQFPAGAKPPC